jgi:hypothetical protein
MVICSLTKRLILPAVGDILFSQDTWQMQQHATSPEPGAATTLCRERKMLAPNNFRNPPHRFASIYLAFVLCEQPVVY